MEGHSENKKTKIFYSAQKLKLIIYKEMPEATEARLCTKIY